jgi:hypothetical protein
VRGDSQLVIDQVMKESSCHDPKMEAYCKAVRRLEDKFDGLELNHVPRKYNEDADELAKIASGRTTVPRTSSLAMSPSPPSNSRIWRSQAPRTPGPPVGTPRRTRPSSWTLASGPPPRTRPKQWRSTRPPLRKIGAPSTSTR